jgi:ribonuclease G
MALELFINAGMGEIRIALARDGRMDELRILPLLGEEARPLGDIILGRVTRVVSGMEAAFVEIGLSRAGFLPLRDTKMPVREGDSILVQVTRDPVGEKGAQLSAMIALAGRLLVMTPARPGIALSRRIEDDAKRAQLVAEVERLRKDAGIAAHTGFIIRTAARDSSLDMLAADMRALIEVWQALLEKAKTQRPPALTYRDLGPIERALRDLGADAQRIVIDDGAALETARAYCRKAMPEAESRLELCGRDLFAREGLEDEIAALASSRVALPSGGWITIEKTEALTAVDVNSGSFIQAGTRDETSLAVNLEAAKEIGRQLRLRDIGGLIVVDFIQLDDEKRLERVVAALKGSFHSDAATVRVSPMGAFGIVAIARQRQGAPWTLADSVLCSHCNGRGRVPHAGSEARAILRALEREATANPGAALLVTAASNVADWFVAHDQEVRLALASRGLLRVTFEADERAGGFNVRRA